MNAPFFLGKSLGDVDDATLNVLRAASKDPAHAGVLDVHLRTFYQTLFSKLRFFDPAIDTHVADGVQQVPNLNGPPAAMEKS